MENWPLSEPASEIGPLWIPPRHRDGALRNLRGPRAANRDGDGDGDIAATATASFRRVISISQLIRSVVRVQWFLKSHRADDHLQGPRSTLLLRSRLSSTERPLLTTTAEHVAETCLKDTPTYVTTHHPTYMTRETHVPLICTSSDLPLPAATPVSIRTPRPNPPPLKAPT